MNEQLNKPLSNYDLLREISKDMKMRGNIVDMREIEKYNDVENVFKGRGHAILFEPPENGDPNGVGHWTCLTRTNKGKCIYFDSYGSKLKDPKLRSILKTKYKEIQYNPHKLQSHTSSVCGRYSLICVGLNKLIPDLDIKHIVKFLQSKPPNKTFDKFILDITGKM